MMRRRGHTAAVTDRTREGRARGDSVDRGARQSARQAATGRVCCRSARTSLRRTRREVEKQSGENSLLSLPLSLPSPRVFLRFRAPAVALLLPAPRLPVRGFLLLLPPLRPRGFLDEREFVSLWMTLNNARLFRRAWVSSHPQLFPSRTHAPPVHFGVIRCVAVIFCFICQQITSRSHFFFRFLCCPLFATLA